MYILYILYFKFVYFLPSYRLHPDLLREYRDLDQHKLRKVVSATALADENKDILDKLIPPDDISGDVDIEKWMQQMELNERWADAPFIQLTAYYFNRDIIIIPIHKEHGNNGTGRIILKARQSSGNPPFYLLNYFNVHFQSIIPIPK